MSTEDRLARKTKQGAISIVSFGWHVSIIKTMFTHISSSYCSVSNGDRDVNNGFPRISKIRFYCNPKVPLGQPKYIEQASEKDGEVFYFDFQTSLACSANQVQCDLPNGGPNNKSYDLTPLGLVTSKWKVVLFGVNTSKPLVCDHLS
jgi:hypothetical protein